MRSHGVPNFPDPGSGGTIPKGTAQQLGVSSAQFQAAELACQHVLPTGRRRSISRATSAIETAVCAPALVQQALSAGRDFAQCMRSHGVPNWPDPAIEPGGGPSSTSGFRPPAPPVARDRRCERLQPAGSLLAWG